MATVKVSTPVPGYSGSVGGVAFAGGVAVVDEDAFAAEVGYFRRTGYTVEDVVASPEPDGEPGEMPKKSASTEAWRAYAVEHGMPQEEADGLSRDQLVELYTKENNS